MARQKKSEIEIIRERTFKRLVGFGYDPEMIRRQVENYVAVVEYFRGKPAVVITAEGNRVYL